MKQAMPQYREFYTVEQNEQFYTQAANRFLRLHKSYSRDQFFDGFQLKKAEFFKTYFQMYKWAKGVWGTKNEAKRMYDGIQRFFINHFDQILHSKILNGVPACQVIDQIRQESYQVFNLSTYNRMMEKWTQIASQLDQSKKYINFAFTKPTVKTDYAWIPQAQTQHGTPSLNYSEMHGNQQLPNLKLLSSFQKESQSPQNSMNTTRNTECNHDVQEMITKLYMILAQQQ